jgi:hypothetical protein
MDLGAPGRQSTSLALPVQPGRNEQDVSRCRVFPVRS